MPLTADNDNAPILISLNDTARMLSVSRTQVNQYRAKGIFPLPVEMGERKIAFVRAEVVAWAEARIAARSARAA